jgi:ribosome-binding factor A
MIEEHEKPASHFHKAMAESIKVACDFAPGMIVTLVRGEITGDSRFAKGTVSVLPDSRGEEALQYLKEAEPDIKRELNKRLRLRIVPALNWGLDHTEEKAVGVEMAIHELRKRGEL